MQQIHRKLLSYILALAFAMANILVVPAATAGVYDVGKTEPSGGAMLADMVLMRPLMLVSTECGRGGYEDGGGAGEIHLRAAAGGTVAHWRSRPA